MGAGESASAGYEVKASALRGYVAVLKKRGDFERLRPKLPADVLAFAESPPPASAWIDARYTEVLLSSYADMVGDRAMRQLSREALSASVAPLIRPIVEGLLRLFGTSPATLFRNTQLMTKNNLRGVEFSYRAIGPHEGEMCLRFPARRGVPLRTFFAFAGAFEVSLDLCGARGTVDDPVLVDDAQKNAATYAIRW